MSDLQDMLRVQARLHRKQGANALGDLFENALNEIELLKKTYNQLFDAVQSEREQLAKANERVTELEEWVAAISDDHPSIPDWIKQSARSLIRKGGGE